MSFNSELVGSTVELLVLTLLSERTMYGYEMVQIVNARTEGAFQWKEGTLYPVLHRLDAQGYVATEWQPGDAGKPRKYYCLTAKGTAYATAKQEAWHTFAGSVNAVLCQPA